MEDPTPTGPPPPSGDGLLSWLIGGLAVGLVVLGAVLIGYKVGYDNGRDSVEAAAAPTQPTETRPTETQPTETETEPTETETEPTETEPAEPDGASVFAEAGCNTCHTLSAAGASGTVGPNLDDLLPTEEQVMTIVTNGRGAMPAFADQLTPEEIEAVSTYVADAAGS